MEFSVTKKAFSKQVGMALKGIPAKTDQLILKSFLIEAIDNTVVVTSTNEVISVVSETPAIVQEEGKVCVDAKLLDGILKKVKKDIEIFFRLEDGELVIEIDSSIMKINTQNPLEYPTRKEVTKELSFETDVEHLQQSIKQTSFSTIKSESRPILSGVLCSVEDEYLSMVSTDGHRMSKKVLKVIEVEGTGLNEVIIPVDSLVQVERILKAIKKGQVHVSLSKEGVQFSSNGVLIYTSLIKGEFLNYKQVYDMKGETKTILERKYLLDVLEKATTLLPKDGVAIATLDMNDDLVCVQIQTVAGNVEETLEANMIGESITIGFNLSYLVSALKAITEDRISFSLIDSTSPTIIQGVGNKAYRHMLLPIKPKLT